MSDNLNSLRATPCMKMGVNRKCKDPRVFGGTCDDGLLGVLCAAYTPSIGVPISDAEFEKARDERYPPDIQADESE